MDLLASTYHLAQISITFTPWEEGVQRGSPEKRGDTGCFVNRHLLLWNLFQGGKPSDNEKYLHYCYLLQIIGLSHNKGFILCNLIVWYREDTEIRLHPSSAGAECHLLLWAEARLPCHAVYRAPWGRGDGNAHVSCFPPSDSWRAVWQPKGRKRGCISKYFQGIAVKHSDTKRG